MTKYDTKGSFNSDKYDVSFKSIIQYFTNDDDNNKTVGSVHAQHMYEIIIRT